MILYNEGDMKVDDVFNDIFSRPPFSKCKIISTHFEVYTDPERNMDDHYTLLVIYDTESN